MILHEEFDKKEQKYFSKDNFEMLFWVGLIYLIMYLFL